jgi:hypothetical protein
MMSERIKELTDKIWAKEYWTDPNTDKLLPAQLNRFAELIVRECLHNVENCDGDLDFAIWKTKQDFGVDE